MYKNKTTTQEELFSLEQLSLAKMYIRALDHELRLNIIAFLDQNPNCIVKNIYKSLNIEQSIASQQLRILKMAGFVTDKRDGKNVMYSINYDKLSNIQNAIANFINKDENK